MEIILASASPRRRELMSRLCTFSVIPAKGEEKADKTLPSDKYACALAEGKCEEVFATHPDCLVIGCDTVVSFRGTIYGKPKDEEDARRILRELSGNLHEVFTGVCVHSPYKKLIAAECTEVRFRKLDEEFIEKYVASGAPMDKAGAYGIQDLGAVAEYKGSYTNVVGLPVALVKKMMAAAMRQ